MISKKIQQTEFSKENIRLVDEVTYNRAPPKRRWDQIYMHGSDMLSQADVMEEYIEGEDVLFLGDGDSMSTLFGALSSKGEIEGPSEMTVLDFDKRILEKIEEFANLKKFEQNDVILRTDPYNVLDPPPEKVRGKFSFFYINPPYGSKNEGESGIIWVQRCMEMCTASCTGCIIIPYDRKKEWSIKATRKIQSYLLENGFAIRGMIPYMHKYHLRDNPVLQSATMIVDRVEPQASDFEGEQIPKEVARTLYGSERRIPRYIGEDDEPDFDWRYNREPDVYRYGE